jgi:hypothetical protein
MERRYGLACLLPQPVVASLFDCLVLTDREETVMKKISLIAATLVGAAVLCAAPISLHQSQDKALSLSVDKAQAYYGHGRRVHRRVHRRYYYHGHYYNHRGYYHHHYRYW